MNFIIVGAVQSTDIAIRQIVKNGFMPNHIYGLDPKLSENVSGYIDLNLTAEEIGIDFTYFNKINDYIEDIKAKEPDFIFVIGLSQLVSEELINCAKEYVIGLHPTKLPQFRGRASVPWQIILGVEESAVTLFKIGKGMDDGDIICQSPYQIGFDDYAQDVHNSVEKALEKAIDTSISEILNKKVKFVKQNEDDATYLLIRRPEDGLINWNDSAIDIYNLIRATSYPYPGAFSYYNGIKVIFDKVELVENHKIIGIRGQISNVDKDFIDICVGNKIIRVTQYTSEETINFIIGKKFNDKR